jgi:DNA-binding MarR family transcriptional regulator
MSNGSDNVGAAASASGLAAPALRSAQDDAESRHMAGLLASVEREAHVSQRQLAGQLGVALGLVNTYIRRCVKKGLIKVEQVPTRRYAYYLTPTGFAEKSRLTAEFLYWSLSFFRRARAECSELFEEAKRRGWAGMALAGGGDLAEIAILCASEQGVKIVAIVDSGIRKPEVLGVPVFASFDVLPVRPDGWMITGIQDAQALHDAVVVHAGADRLLTPPILSVRESSRSVQS